MWQSFFPLKFRLILLTYFLQVVTQTAALAVDEKEDFKSELAKLSEVFSPPSFPTVKGKKWVVVERGPSNPTKWRPFDTEGWLLEDGPKEVLLLDWFGNTHKLRKPLTNERRPSLKPDKHGAISIQQNIWQAPDQFVAWNVSEADYSAKIKKFLIDGLPKESADGNVFGFANAKFKLAGHIVDAARHAHYANQLDQIERAEELLTYGRKVHKEYEAAYIDKAKSFTSFVADRIATECRNTAIWSGHGDTPRKELLPMWKKLVALPNHDYRNEAKVMVKQYEKLLDEDARWVEPDAKALSKLTVDQKVEYWLYHLRDLSVGQSSDPGTCRVLYEFDKENPKKPNAAVELKKLGMAAVPRLIAHLDDERPTRSKGHWRSYWPDGHYLLRYGDCCQQIFEGITKQRITKAEYPIGEGKGKECKEKAEKWWQENKAKVIPEKP